MSVRFGEGRRDVIMSKCVCCCVMIGVREFCATSCGPLPQPSPQGRREGGGEERERERERESKRERESMWCQSYSPVLQLFL